MEKTIIQEKIEEKIKKDSKQALYVMKDFFEFGDYNSVKEAISRLVSKHVLTRINKGIYMKTYFSTFLNEEACASLEDVAKLIAKKNHWTIIPSGDTALNILHLSTQVPVEYHYASSGENRKIKVKDYKMIIYFHHRPLKEIEGLSPLSAIIVEAIRTTKVFFKRGLEAWECKEIKSLLKEKDRINLKNETRECRVWVKEEIKKILEK